MPTDRFKHILVSSDDENDILLSIGPSRQSETVHSITTNGSLSNPDVSTQTWAELGLLSGWDWSETEHPIVVSGSLH